MEDAGKGLQGAGCARLHVEVEYEEEDDDIKHGS